MIGIQVRNFLRANGIKHVFIDNSSKINMQKDVARKLEQGIDTLITVGGDGTLNAVAKPIIQKHSPAVLMPVPAGTGNDLYNSMTNRKFKIERIEQLLARKSCPKIDVGFVKTQSTTVHFLNGMGIGFDGDVLKNLKKFKLFHGDMLYTASVIYSFFNFKAFKAELIIKNLENTIQRTGSFMLLDAGNGKYLGGGYKLFPLSSMKDNLLDLTAIESVNAILFLRTLWEVMKGTFIKRKQVFYTKAKHIRINLDRKLFYHVDGELKTEEKIFDISISPKMIGVLV